MNAHLWSSAARIVELVSLLGAACAPAAAPPPTATQPPAAKPAAATQPPAANAPAATTAPAAKPAGSGVTGTVSVAMVGNPQMKTLEQLKGDFESSHPGITLNLLVLPENQVRDKVTTDIATNAAQWAFAMEANSKNKPAAYEFPKWATSKDFVNLVGQKSGWGAVPSGARKSTYDVAGY